MSAWIVWREVVGGVVATVYREDSPQMYRLAGELIERRRAQFKPIDVKGKPLSQEILDQREYRDRQLRGLPVDDLG